MSELKRVTIKDLASEADVHYSTVSRVMNPATRHLVTDEVANRILQLAEARGFRPNRIAAGLRTQRSGLIGILLPDIANPVFPPILAGIEAVLARLGYVPIVVNTGVDRSRQRFVVDQMLARQVEGLILAIAEREDRLLDYCVKVGIPVVMVNRSERNGRASCVVSDSGLAMQLTVDHLFALGHRCIGHIAGPAHTSTGELRREGFLQAVQHHRLRDDEYLVVEAESYAREAGRMACAQMFESLPCVTAIAACNDLVAMGCYDYLREHGIRCPEDVSVVGHNDMPFVDALTPPLTTVRIPVHDMGEQAAELLLRRIDKPGAPSVVMELGPELVVRGSTAAPPSSRQH